MKRPHIVIIVVDDLGKSCMLILITNPYFKGWADVPWNNPNSVARKIGSYAK